MSGRIENDRLILGADGGHVVAAFARAEGKPATVVCFTRDEPLRVALVITEMRESDYWDLWTNPEITFDHPAFDDALLVRGPEGPVRTLLDDEARAALLELSGRADHVRVDAATVTALALGEPLTAARLEPLIDAVLSVARELSPRRDRRGRAGPYRG